MNGDGSWPASSSNAQAALEDTSNSVDSGSNDSNLPNTPLQTSSLSNDNFLQDDSTSIFSYSYHSTWSSNYTMSNLVGPGRLLGNLFSSTGSSLERQLGKLAYRTGLGGYAKAEKDLALESMYSMVRSEDMVQKEKACSILLGHASSNNPAIQIMAFVSIVYYVVRSPALRNAAGIVCQKRNEHIDVVTFSWKRPGLDYDFLWLNYYNAAVRCFSTHPSSVINAIENLGLGPGDVRTSAFSDFEDVLACCRDKADTMIMVDCIHWNWDWDWKGLDAYVKRKGYNDSALLKLAVTFCTLLSDIVTCHSRHPATRCLVDIHNFIKGVWESLRTLELDKSDDLLEDGSQLALWTEIFNMHCILRSSITRQLISAEDRWFLKIKKTWKEECYKELPKPEHAKLREWVLQLEDIYGDAMRKRFPLVNEDEE